MLGASVLARHRRALARYRQAAHFLLGFKPILQLLEAAHEKAAHERATHDLYLGRERGVLLSKAGDSARVHTKPLRLLYLPKVLFGWSIRRRLIVSRTRRV